MSLDRRRMLMLTLGGGAFLASRWAGLKSPQPAAETAGLEFTRRGWALGSDVAMTVFSDSAEQAEMALTAAFAELESVEKVMSLYRPDSQICRLNRDRFLADPDLGLVEVLLAAASMSRLSGGAFDITVQPLWELMSRCRREGRLPLDEELQWTQRTVDWRGVKIGRDNIRLIAPVESITLNGIAQGYAADRALATLRTAGIQDALINAGEIGSLGSKPAGKPWVVGIQHPRVPEAYSAVVSLDGRSLATSGDYETAFSADFANHHIFDPRTGRSPHELASVSIVAPSGLEADSLSTAAMVLGPERTLSLVRQMTNVDAFLVLKSGETVQTPGFPQPAIV